MKYNKSGSLLFVIGIVTTVSVFLASCTLFSESTVAIPTFEGLKTPPIEVTIDELWRKFQENPEIATTNYKGQRLVFSNILAEHVNSAFLDARAGDNIWIRSGPVEFRPRYYQDFDGILPGFMCNIVGDCLGLRWNRLVITDCWIEVISGELGDVVADVY